MTRVSLSTDDEQTIHALGGSVIVPLRGSQCSVESGGQRHSLSGDDVRWLDGDDMKVASSASGRCDAYVVEVKKPLRAGRADWTCCPVDDKYQTVVFENGSVRVVRFRLAPHSRWDRGPVPGAPIPPSVSIVTGGASLVTRRAWEASPGALSWTAREPEGTRQSGSAGAIAPASEVALENVGDTPYEVVTIQLKQFEEVSSR